MSSEALVTRSLPGDAALVELATRLGLERQEWVARGARRFAATVLSDEAGSQLRIEKDHVLGQCVVRASGPRSRELRAAVAASLGEWSLNEALRAAQEASSAATRIETLGPLTALVSARTVWVAAALPVFAERLRDESVAVRRATLLALSYLADLPEAAIGELLETALDDPELTVEAERQLALRRPQHDESDPAIAVDDVDAWLELAAARQARGQRRSALSAALSAMAVARRQGLRLRELQRQVNELRAASATDDAATAAEPLSVVLDLGAFLRSGRTHEAEEVAELLQAAAPRELSAALFLLTAIARLMRRRPERAAEALLSAVAAIPWPESSYLLGRCHELLDQPTEAAAAFTAALADDGAGTTPDTVGVRAQAVRLLELVLDRPTTPLRTSGGLVQTSEWFDPRELSFKIAALLVEQGQLEAALLRIDSVLARDPAADAWLASATVHNLLLQPQAALSALERAEATLSPRERLVDEEDPRAAISYQRALAWAHLGQPAEALKAAVAAVVAEPLEIERISQSPSLREALALPDASSRLTAAAARGQRTRAFFQAAKHSLQALGRSADSVALAAKAALVDCFVAVVSALERRPDIVERERIAADGEALAQELAMLAELGKRGPEGADAGAGAEYGAALEGLRAAMAAAAGALGAEG